MALLRSNLQIKFHYIVLYTGKMDKKSICTLFSDVSTYRHGANLKRLIRSSVLFYLCNDWYYQNNKPEYTGRRSKLTTKQQKLSRNLMAAGNCFRIPWIVPRLTKIVVYSRLLLKSSLTGMTLLYFVSFQLL